VTQTVIFLMVGCAVGLGVWRGAVGFGVDLVTTIFFCGFEATTAVGAAVEVGAGLLTTTGLTLGGRVVAVVVGRVTKGFIVAVGVGSVTTGAATVGVDVGVGVVVGVSVGSVTMGAAAVGVSVGTTGAAAVGVSVGTTGAAAVGVSVGTMGAATVGVADGVAVGPTGMVVTVDVTDCVGVGVSFLSEEPAGPTTTVRVRELLSPTASPRTEANSATSSVSYVPGVGKVKSKSTCRDPPASRFRPSTWNWNAEPGEGRHNIWKPFAGPSP
jgi:hypothetical protein